MTRTTLGAIAAAAGGVISTLSAAWPGALLDNGEQRATGQPVMWFGAHLAAGALAITALLIAYRFTGFARALLLLATAVLVVMLVFEPFDFLNFITGIIPAAFMLAAAFTIGPPPLIVER